MPCRGLKQDYNSYSAGLLFCVNSKMRLPALQILLVLFEELKPISFIINLRAQFGPELSVLSMVREVIGLLGG